MHRKDKKIFFISTFLILIFNCCSIVFGADYIFNGETLPATSSYQDTYYGVETMQNILDDLAIIYDDTTILGFTYHCNQALKFWRATYDENTTPLNICFIKYSTYTDRVVMIPSNGTFDDDLPYMFWNTLAFTSASKINAFTNWNYDTNGNITSATTSNISYITVYADKYQINSGNQQFNNTNLSQSGSVVYCDNILAPIESFTVAGRTSATGYSWYFVGNLINFTEEPEIPSGDTPENPDDPDNPGTGGGTGGNVDLTMTNAKIDELNKHAEDILNKMPSSGDMQEIVSNETDKIVGLFSGEASIINSGESMAGDLTLEQITEKIDFNIIDNPYQALWDDLLNLLTGAMLSSGNQTITFETRSGTHTVNSDDIKSPDEIKEFLSIFSNAAILMAMFIEIQKLIIKISEGNASYVLHMGDADMYFYDDCQLF